MELLHSRDFLKIVSQLNSLKAGIEKNTDLTEVTQNISVEEIERIIKEITDARSIFVENKIKSQMSKDLYRAAFKNGKNFLASKGRIIRGILGVSAKRVMDFGYEPYKLPEEFKKDKDDESAVGGASASA